jgi:hypothetical protein
MTRSSSNTFYPNFVGTAELRSRCGEAIRIRPRFRGIFGQTRLVSSDSLAILLQILVPMDRDEHGRLVAWLCADEMAALGGSIFARARFLKRHLLANGTING